jgi:hypothetical protein
MSITLSKNLKTIEHEFAVKLTPTIFRDQFEIHGIKIAKRQYVDKCPEPGDEEESDHADYHINTVGLTVKGKPDKREQPSWYGGGQYSLVFCHALVLLMDEEQRAFFGDTYRDKAIRISARLERLSEMGLSEEQLAKYTAEVAAEFDADVEEAKQIITANCVRKES